MKLPCETVKDLLPLYTDELISQTTRELMDAHFQECASCTRELESLRNGLRLMDVEPAKSLNQVRKAIRLRRLIAVLAVVMTLVSITFSALVFLMTPIYLSAEDAVDSVYLQENGGLVIDYARCVMGDTHVNAANGNTMFFCHTTRYDWLRARQQDQLLANMTENEILEYLEKTYTDDGKGYRQPEFNQDSLDRFMGKHTIYGFKDEKGNYLYSYEPVMDAENDERFGTLGELTPAEHEWNLIYTKKDGTVDRVLWKGADAVPRDTHMVKYSGNVWAAAFWGSVILTIGLLAWHLLTPENKRRRWKITVAIAFASVAFAVGLVSNFDFSPVSLYLSHAWMDYVVIEAPLVFVSGLLWRQMYLFAKADKGI